MSFPRSATPLQDVQRVLCVFAHPDDVDFGCAGTVAGWVDAGIEVGYLLVTRGDAGGFDDTPRALMPALREAEQRAAAAVVGVRHVEFLDGYRDGILTASIELRRDITAAIRRFRPDRVLTNSPLRRWDRIAGPSHPDHLAAGEASTPAAQMMVSAAIVPAAKVTPSACTSVTGVLSITSTPSSRSAFWA